MEFLFPFCSGFHLFFLTRLPSPAVIAEAFKEICPDVVIAVPLIIEKIIRKRVFPKIQNNAMKLMLQMPVVKDKVRERICKEVFDAFGGRAYEVIVGGAPLNQEIEKFRRTSISPSPSATVRRSVRRSSPIATITTSSLAPAARRCPVWK